MDPLQFIGRSHPAVLPLLRHPPQLGKRTPHEEGPDPGVDVLRESEHLLGRSLAHAMTSITSGR